MRVYVRMYVSILTGMHTHILSVFVYVHMYVVTHMQLHTDTLCMYMYVYAHDTNVEK